MAMSNMCETVQSTILKNLSTSKRTIYVACNRQGECQVQGISDILDHHASYILLDPFKRPESFADAEAVKKYIESRNEVVVRSDLTEEEQKEKLNKEMTGVIDLT